MTVVIVGISGHPGKVRRLFSIADDGTSIVKEADNINAYLVAGPNLVVKGEKRNRNGYDEMVRGNTGNDGGHLYLIPDFKDHDS